MSSELSIKKTAIRISRLRTEWLVNPTGIESVSPRFSWCIESDERGQKQTAYQILASTNLTNLERHLGDKWDTGKVISGETLNIAFQGETLRSNELIYWKVKVWDKDGSESAWSEIAHWSMGLLRPDDWKARWITYRDPHPLHNDPDKLFLPPAQYYRKEFTARKTIKRATAFVSALGIFDFYINGELVGDAYFQPGWSDYLKRAYYRTYDVTSFLKKDQNVLGAVVTDGWYSGYVGFGLLVGYGPNKMGRYMYGKTPALLIQVAIEYADETQDCIFSDSSWDVTNQGPVREGDLIMGETFNAGRVWSQWCAPYRQKSDADRWDWQKSIEAETVPSCKAIFTDTLGAREVELSFQKPEKLQSYCAPPIRVTQKMQARRISEPKAGTYIFDFGQNFAGIVEIRVRGAIGCKVQLRYGERLYDDGQLMTENLRKARATDYYILSGNPEGEVWSPRFTYHGFQYVEITGLSYCPNLDDVVGLVLHNDTELTGYFECSDEVLTKFSQNALWTQRANFVEVPTDCPQRDERLGWMADAQAFIRAASFNADISAFYTKWLDDVREAQLPYGAYPDYCPFPMSHGKSFSTAWSDAGIICPWTIWKVYADTCEIEKQWDSMVRFMEWRAATSIPNGLGTAIGNHWGDWLSAGENTPIEYIDICYHALDCRLMEEMALAVERKSEAAHYRERKQIIRKAFQNAYVQKDGALKIDTQTAYALALCFDLVPNQLRSEVAGKLAEKIRRNDYRMATGFLGTRLLLPALSANGFHDLAVRIFQSREYPSWGYEVVNGATSVWERWDSYTTENGFNGQDGKQNAAMNSFSHYAFGSVMEWAYRDLAGIDTEDAGYRKIQIRPGFASTPSIGETESIDWVKAEYQSVRGKIRVAWKLHANIYELSVTIPANTTAQVYLPAQDFLSIRESGSSLEHSQNITFIRMSGPYAVLEVDSGSYCLSSFLDPIESVEEKDRPLLSEIV